MSRAGARERRLHWRQAADAFQDAQVSPSVSPKPAIRFRNSLRVRMGPQSFRQERTSRPRQAGHFSPVLALSRHMPAVAGTWICLLEGRFMIGGGPASNAPHVCGPTMPSITISLFRIRLIS